MISTLKSKVNHLLSATDNTDPFEKPIEERSDYPTDEDGVPRVPEEDLIGVFPRDSTWGNKIQFDNFESRRVYGWVTVGKSMFVGGGRVVEEGDLFGYEMDSGEIAVFRLVNVENQTDPTDMFFADALDIGYVEEDDD